MSDYRRAFLKGGTFFFTVVTYQRYPIFREESNVRLFRKCIKNTMAKYPFTINAIAILPDHLHTIWTLPEGESDFSNRWKNVKTTFSVRYTGLKAKNISHSMIKKNEKGIWQRRFWEHVIRDEEDYNRYCDYIHYNPVKHGFVSSPAEWVYGSFRDFVKKGIYPDDWGYDIKEDLKEMDLE